MLRLLLVAPPAFLCLAALLCPGLPLYRPRLQRGVATAAFLAVLSAIAALGAVWARGGEALRLTVSPWASSVFRIEPALQLDRLGGFCLVLVCLAAAAATLRPRDDDDLRALGPALAVAAAAALFVLAVQAPLGLVFAWQILDLVILVGAGGGRRGLLGGQLGLLMVVAGLATLPFEPLSGGGAPLAAVSPAGRFWLLSAAAVRMGLFPVWWTVPRTPRDRPWLACATRLAPTVAGASLMMRLGGFAPHGEVLQGAALWMILLSALVGAILSYLASNRIESLDWQTTVHATLVVAAAGLGGPVGRAIALVLLVDLVITRGGLYLSTGLARAGATRPAHWILAAAATALPPTLGFAGRWLLYRELLLSDLTAVLLIAVVATVGSTAALWDMLRLRTPGLAAGRAASLGVLTAGLLQLALGLGLAILDPVVIALTGSSLPFPLLDAWLTLASRLTFASGVVLVAAVLAPAILSVPLRRQPLAWGDARRRTLRRVLRLSGPIDRLATSVVVAGESVQRGTGLLESRRAMPWTLMAVSVAATAMLVPSGSAAAGAGPTSWWHIAAFLAAALVSSLVVLSSNPAIVLGALGGAYLLAAALLWWTGASPILAVVKVIVGSLVIGILGISVLQAPLDRRHLAGAARHLASLRAPDGGPASRWLPGLALLGALLLGYGIQAQVAGEWLPAGVLHPVLGLVAGGVLTAVFARRALRLAVGVLLVLVGFEVVYGLLDPGLVITGGLAAFQLLFAVVASHYVGMPAGAEASG